MLMEKAQKLTEKEKHVSQNDALLHEMEIHSVYQIRVIDIIVN